MVKGLYSKYLSINNKLCEELKLPILTIIYDLVDNQWIMKIQII